MTLGVADLARSVAFYTSLGWDRASSSGEEIAWFRTADSWLGLFPYAALAADTGIDHPTRGSFGGVTLAINVESEDEVPVALEAAVAAGGTLLKPATRAEWGGFSGYFADPDGHTWEVAWNPGFPVGKDGRITIP